MGDITDGAVKVSAAWTAPPVSWLVLNNCDVATDWAAAAGQIISSNTTSDDVAVGIVAEYLESMIPSNWTDKPSDADLAVWYINYFNNETLLDFNNGTNALTDFLDDMFDFPIFECGTTICSKLDWEGDPDVSGVGVSRAAPSILQPSVDY